MTRGKRKQTQLSQTNSRMRTPGRKYGKGGQGNKISQDAHRHEKLKQRSTAAPMRRGAGFNERRNGVVVTHPQVPKWKKERARKYKELVWQTVLISKSSRLPNSNNALKTNRYPIKVPECLDGEKVMTMLFSPFCSHFSGIHSTMFKHVNAAGTGLEHAINQRLDVIQNKADTSVFRAIRRKIEGTRLNPPKSETGGKVPEYNAALIVGAENRKAIINDIDQLVRQCNVDLVFTASRAFPVVVSVSVVRMLEPTEPYTLTADDTKNLCNSLDNRGSDWHRMKTEWSTTFTLPELKAGRKPPTVSVNKKLFCNFMQTNSFNQDSVADTMTEAANDVLGQNINPHSNEIADGHASGQFYVLIKYRKKQQPQQFIYKQVIESHADNIAHASIELPVLTEESFDVPVLNGNATTAQIPGGADAALANTISGNTGAPFSTNQGDESKATFYLHGKLTYCWGFREITESLPSLMNELITSADYKKPQSLMIDPTYTAPNPAAYGCYTQSLDHKYIQANTAGKPF